METTEPKRPWPWYVRIVVGRNPLITLLRAVVWAALIVFIFKFVFIGIRVRGHSMEPTYHEGQIKFLNRIAYMRAPPHRGDVVAIRAPELGAVLLKRVLGLPGEHVTVRGGRIYIDSKIVDEDYTKGRTNFRVDRDLEPSQYYLIGDNRDVTDHYFKYDYQIIGRVIR